MNRFFIGLTTGTNFLCLCGLCHKKICLRGFREQTWQRRWSYCMYIYRFIYSVFAYVKYIVPYYDKRCEETDSVQLYLISDPHGHVGSTRSVRLRPRFTLECLERFPLPLGAWGGLRYFIVALPEPSISLFLIYCLNSVHF